MALASRGLRNLNGGTEKIEDPQELARVRRQALWVHLESISAGIALTAITVAVA